MTAFKPQQRHITIEDREFQFVAYEGHAADPKRGKEAAPAMWYLMVEGRRCPVFPYDASVPLEEVDVVLTEWAEENAMESTGRSAAPAGRKMDPANRRLQNWWGGY